MPRPSLPSFLRWGSLAALVAVGFLILFSFRVPPPRESVEIPLAEPLPPPTGEGPGGEGVLERSVRFQAEGSRGGEKSFLLRADETTTLPRDVTRLSGVQLDLFRGPGAGLRVEAPEGIYDARSEEVELRGGVTVRREGRVLLRSERMNYSDRLPLLRATSSLEFRTGGIEGSGSGLEFHPEEDRLDIEGPVLFRLRDASLGEKLLRGRCWHLTYFLPERRVVLREDASLWNAGDRIRAWSLDLLLPQDGERTTRVSAESAVSLSRFRPSEGPFRGAWSDRLDAGLRRGEGLLLSELRLAGSVRATDGYRRARADRAGCSAGRPEAVLAGSAETGRRAGLRTRNREVAAERIELLDRGADLHAAGNVETRLSEDPEGESGMPFPFEPGIPVTVLSGDLRTSLQGRMARFSGGVVAWQGDRQIQADRIQVDEEGGRLEAHQEVLTRFPLGEATGDGTDQPPPHVIIRARALHFDREAGIARYEGGARMDRGLATVLSDRILAEVSPGGGRIRRVVLEGKVRLRQGDRSGRADRGVYLPAEDRLVLYRTRGLVELQDPILGRSLRGRRLTFDLSDGKMRVETGRKGRIFLTLTPGRGDMKSVDPEASH